MTRFVCGANVQELEDVKCRKLGEVRPLLTDILNIPSPVQMVVNGTAVNDDYVLQEGDQVEFIRPAGEKG